MYSIHCRNLKLYYVIYKVQSDEIPDQCLDLDENATVDSVCHLLADIDSVTKKLQGPSLNIADTRTLFNGVRKRLPSINA